MDWFTIVNGRQDPEVKGYRTLGRVRLGETGDIIATCYSRDGKIGKAKQVIASGRS